MSSEAKEQVPHKKKGCSAGQSGLGTLFILAMIPIGIVGIVHGSKYKQEQDIQQTKRELSLHGRSPEEIKIIMEAGQPQPRKSSRAKSHFDVEHARIVADVIRDLAKQGYTAEQMQETLKLAGLNEPQDAVTVRSNRLNVAKSVKARRAVVDEVDRALEKPVEDK